MLPLSIFALGIPKTEIIKKNYGKHKKAIKKCFEIKVLFLMTLSQTLYLDLDKGDNISMQNHNHIEATLHDHFDIMFSPVP